MDLTPDAFAARRRALEDAFFQKRDAELAKNIRLHLAEMEEKQKLTHVSGILDEHVLVDLVHAGVSAETLLAMRFVPMIGVAWADRVVSQEERAAVLGAAEAEGIAAGSPAHKLLEAWLEHKPDQAVFVAWKEYVSALAGVMPAVTLQKLRERTEHLCHKVAKATGGILGVGSISAAEHAAIAEFSGSWGGK
jgi:hypothetical protein